MKDTRCHDCGTFLIKYEEFCPVCNKKNPYRLRKKKFPDSPKNNHYTKKKKKGDRYENEDYED